jgi:hypothetical protein
MYNVCSLSHITHFSWLNDKKITAEHCAELLRAETSHASAEQQLRTLAEVCPKSFVVIGSCISMQRSSFMRKVVDYKSTDKSVGHSCEHFKDKY